MNQQSKRLKYQQPNCQIELGLNSVHPIDLAVLAISNHKLGNVGAAKDYQRKFNQAMQSYEFSKDEECESFRKEVNSAFESQR